MILEGGEVTVGAWDWKNVSVDWGAFYTQRAADPSLTDKKLQSLSSQRAGVGIPRYVTSQELLQQISI